MKKQEIMRRVREYKRMLNGGKGNYPEELNGDVLSIIHWCRSECLDVGEYGLHCPCDLCPLHEVYESTVFPSDEREGV